MTREQMIEAIYEKIAKRINIDGLDGQALVTWDLAPVMIGDVFDYIGKKTFKEFLYNYLMKIWEEKRKPIEEQGNDCIEFVFNLISKK